jgi:hypothetical protein
MSRIRIDDALYLAEQIRAKKSELVKSNIELFDQIKSLDDMLKDIIDEIYVSEDLTAYDTITINQSLNLNNILNKSVKLGVGFKDPNESCSNYSRGKVKVFFIDTEEFTEASALYYGEDTMELVKEELYLSDGSNIRLWANGEFDKGYNGVCKIK